MGFLDKLLRRGRDTATEHGDTITSGVDKATDVVDDKTGGKYADHTQKVDDAAERLVDKADGTSDEPAPPPPAAPPPPTTP
jgi:MT0933-like antitoxin protein